MDLHASTTSRRVPEPCGPVRQSPSCNRTVCHASLPTPTHRRVRAARGVRIQARASTPHRTEFSARAFSSSSAAPHGNLVRPRYDAPATTGLSPTRAPEGTTPHGSTHQRATSQPSQSSHRCQPPPPPYGATLRKTRPHHPTRLAHSEFTATREQGANETNEINEVNEKNEHNENNKTQRARRRQRQRFSSYVSQAAPTGESRIPRFLSGPREEWPSPRPSRSGGRGRAVRPRREGRSRGGGWRRMRRVGVGRRWCGRGRLGIPGWPRVR